MRVLILTTILAPYRVELFEELGKKIDLTVMFEQKHDTVRDKSWYENTHKTFDAIYLKKWDRSLRYLKVHVLQQLLKQKPDKVIIYEYSTITAMFLMTCCQILRIPYGINCDGGFVSHHIVKDFIKNHYISRASFCLAGGKCAREYLMSYGAKPDQIQTINFTSLRNADIIEKPLDNKQKCLIRKKLGVHEEHMVLFVGSFISRKGVDILLKACWDLENTALVLVGGTDITPFMSEIGKKPKVNIYIEGFQSKDDVKNYYQAADVFVLPTREDIWGLVVNEAMAAGLPVITTNHCGAGLELIEDGKNGYIVPVDNVNELCTKIRLLLQNDEKRLEMARNTLTVIPQYTIENMSQLTQKAIMQLDSDSNYPKTDAIEVICNVFHVKADKITNITVLKKGMTNRSFLFTCKEKKYIMRIPGEGTEHLINRREEADVYQIISGKDICDNIVYMNPENGYKITEFLEGARVCDPLNEDDLQKCMAKLRSFHNMELTVDHEFDIFDQIDFYENLWDGTASIYKDYRKTKEKVFSLKYYIEENIEKKVLTHIDAVPDNFLFIREDVRLIDWEYAGMQDPHVDIAMFCLYSLYNKRQVDHLINIYFQGHCLDAIRIKIYCYISACGLLWSNWCEYKRNLGVEFREYSSRQYQFAKEYYQIVQDELFD